MLKLYRETHTIRQVMEEDKKIEIITKEYFFNIGDDFKDMFLSLYMQNYTKKLQVLLTIKNIDDEFDTKRNICENTWQIVSNTLILKNIIDEKLIYILDNLYKNYNRVRKLKNILT